jgi:hypothetical protein
MPMVALFPNLNFIFDDITVLIGKANVSNASVFLLPTHFYFCHVVFNEV